MHIFCPECGKHIDVSIQEIEKLEGHFVCPQCLTEIDLDIETRQAPTVDNNLELPPAIGVDNKPEAAPHDAPSVAIDDSNSQPVAPDSGSAQPPSLNPNEQPPEQPPHVDDVMRYCKLCGAFLKEGANFCPKCGAFVKIHPPKYRPQQSSSPPPYQKQKTHKTKIRKEESPNMAARKQNTSARKGNSTKSKFDVLSIGGCLTLTVIIVALFFIVYIIIGE